MNRKQAGYILVVIGVAIGLIVFYVNSRISNINRTFSPYTLLTSSWEKYKKEYIGVDGRVIDKSQNNVTTSEGQSYAMLRAVFIDDKSSFDLAWKWTKENMKRPNDNLFGWRWGQRADKSYGFMENGGDNSASDADSDIALSLILAKRRWGDSKYEDAAKVILTDLWNTETDQANGKRYLIAGNWAKSQSELIINPSYWSPYAWRIFAKVDDKNDWNSLIGPAYDLLNQSGKVNLAGKNGVGLPPDWIAIERNSGNLQVPSTGNLDTDYSFDAMRVPWRIYLDWDWNKENKAKDYLTNNFGVLREFYQRDGRIPTIISHDGSVIKSVENPAMYATALGYFLAADPQAAKQIYQDKIVKLYSNDSNTFLESIPYYELNWLWFGTALYDQQLFQYT
ncbi:MAG TPA: glycosyl hydrolase family 8 [Patescibacteria group bacterium]